MSLWYARRKPCTYLATTLTMSPNGPNQIPHDTRHLGFPSGASKMISEPIVRLAQTVVRCTVCAECNIGSEIILDTPDGTPR
jgi:hypothetical protein